MIQSHVLRAALACANIGWRVLPVEGKRPSGGEGWPTRASNDPQEIVKLFTEPHDGVGVLLGAASGIVDLEIDDPKGEATLRWLFDGNIPQTPAYSSERGIHRLFRHHPGIPGSHLAKYEIDGLEFRLGGEAAQSVFPPSGGRKWIVRPDRCPVAEIPQDALDRLRERREQIENDKQTAKGRSALPKTPTAAHQQDDGEKLDVARYLQRHGVPILGQDIGQDGANRWFIECPGKAAHTNANGAKDCVITQEHGGKLGGQCFHRSCGMTGWQELKNAIGPPTSADYPHGSQPKNHGNASDHPRVHLDWLSVFSQEGRTDIANGRRLARLIVGKARFVRQWKKWILWDGARWRIDQSGEIIELAKLVPVEIFANALRSIDGDAIKVAMRFATNSSDRPSLNAMVSLAASEPGISIDIANLDSDPWLLNVTNGTIDLRTGELRHHDPDNLITKVCPVAFDPDAESYEWDRFLEGVFVRQNLIDYVNRLMGYCLTGSTREQKLPIFYGEGSNGKSTLLTAFMGMIGPDYTTQAPPSLMMVRKSESHPTELASLFGMRLVVATETEQGGRLNESLVKALTGSDTITARRMREDFWQFAPSHKLILCTNHKPEIGGSDHAIWRRLKLVPFNQKFTEEQQDKALPDKLKACAPGILAWAVRGCIAWYLDGLQSTNDVEIATEGYRSEQDLFGRFIGDRCLTGLAVYRVKFSQLFSALESWCNDSGDNLPTRKAFGEWLQSNGYEPKHSGCLWYLRITTKPNLGQGNITREMADGADFESMK